MSDTGCEKTRRRRKEEDKIEKRRGTGMVLTRGLDAASS
jgi:hypothetical protein